MAATEKLVSTKEVKIVKANQTIVAILAICSFITVFSLVASKTLISQYSYQSRVTKASQATLNKIDDDQTAAKRLISSYQTFANQGSNIIGGNPSGTGSQDGPSSKIISDALPSKYDFPALITYMNNLLNGSGVTVVSLTGTDTGSGAAATTSSTTTTVAPSSSGAVAIPISFAVSGSYPAIQAFINNLESSVRPIQILTVSFSGSDQNLTATFSAQSYYLPVSGLTISSEIIK